MRSWLYAIQAGRNGPIKIGQTMGIVRGRLQELQVGHHQKLRLLATSVLIAERDAHAKWAGQRIRGEWFRCSPELVTWIRSWEKQATLVPRKARPAARPRVHCLYCGKLLKPVRGAGRRRRYCDRSHKDKAYRARVRHLLAGIRR
jgi:hypothetical protein